MEDSMTLNRHQRRFLAQLRAFPLGPIRWPRRAALLRWLEHPAFRAKMLELAAVHEFAVLFQAQRAATRAAMRLPDALEDPAMARALLRVMAKPGAVRRY
jgi:hypothetical protein